ncbi:MAG: hypothetical protein ACT4TC_04670 [Myxococcaceae bacterium]
MIHNNNRSGSNDDNGDENSGHAVDPSKSSGSSPPVAETDTTTEHPCLVNIREIAAEERQRSLSPLGYGGPHDYLAQRGRSTRASL